jgi:glutathione S-transferase
MNKDQKRGTSKMKLYYHPISTYSQKALIALYEKELDFEPEIVSLMNPEARQKYHEVYPMGKIPCLQLEDGHIIPEASIIIEYLDPLAEPTLIKGNADETRCCSRA